MTYLIDRHAPGRPRAVGVVAGVIVAASAWWPARADHGVQAMRMTFFFFLPSIPLSGFMFPFRGIPDWAQWIGEALPLTHFDRIVRGIVPGLLRAILPDIRPIGAYFLAVATLALVRYRRTLD